MEEFKPFTVDDKNTGRRAGRPTASGAFGILSLNFVSHPKNSLDVGGVLWVRLQLVP